ALSDARRARTFVGGERLNLAFGLTPTRRVFQEPRQRGVTFDCARGCVGERENAPRERPHFFTFRPYHAIFVDVRHGLRRRRDRQKRGDNHQRSKANEKILLSRYHFGPSLSYSSGWPLRVFGFDEFLRGEALHLYFGFVYTWAVWAFQFAGACVEFQFAWYRSDSYAVVENLRRECSKEGRHREAFAVLVNFNRSGAAFFAFFAGRHPEDTRFGFGNFGVPWQLFRGEYDLFSAQRDARRVYAFVGLEGLQF